MDRDTMLYNAFSAVYMKFNYISIKRCLKNF